MTFGLGDGFDKDVYVIDANGKIVGVLVDKAHFVYNPYVGRRKEHQIHHVGMRDPLFSSISVLMHPDNGEPTIDDVAMARKVQEDQGRKVVENQFRVVLDEIPEVKLVELLEFY